MCFYFRSIYAKCLKISQLQKKWSLRWYGYTQPLSTVWNTSGHIMQNLANMPAYICTCVWVNEWGREGDRKPEKVTLIHFRRDSVPGTLATSTGPCHDSQGEACCKLKILEAQGLYCGQPRHELSLCICYLMVIAIWFGISTYSFTCVSIVLSRVIPNPLLIGNHQVHSCIWAMPARHLYMKVPTNLAHLLYAAISHDVAA